MAAPMEILLRHAGKSPPTPGQPGIFALGAPGILERLFHRQWFCGSRATHLDPPVPVAIGRASIGDDAGRVRSLSSGSRCRPEAARVATWAEVSEALQNFATPTGFVARPAEVRVAAGIKLS